MLTHAALQRMDVSIHVDIHGMSVATLFVPGMPDLSSGNSMDLRC